MKHKVFITVLYLLIVFASGNAQDKSVGFSIGTGNTYLQHNSITYLDYMVFLKFDISSESSLRLSFQGYSDTKHWNEWQYQVGNVVYTARNAQMINDYQLHCIYLLQPFKCGFMLGGGLGLSYAVARKTIFDPQNPFLVRAYAVEPNYKFNKKVSGLGITFPLLLGWRQQIVSNIALNIEVNYIIGIQNVKIKNVIKQNGQLILWFGIEYGF